MSIPVVVVRMLLPARLRPYADSAAGGFLVGMAVGFVPALIATLIHQAVTGRTYFGGVFAWAILVVLMAPGIVGAWIAVNRRANSNRPPT